MSDDLIERARLIVAQEALLAEHERAEQAERERDRWKAAALSDTDHFEARVATLEAALRKTEDYLLAIAYPSTLVGKAVALIRAALGDEAAPTERCPTCQSEYRPLIVLEERPWGSCPDPWHPAPPVEDK